MQCAGDFRRRIAEFVGQGRLEGDDGAVGRTCAIAIDASITGNQ